MRIALPLAAALAATVLLPAQRDIHPDELKLKPDIDKAIAKGVKHLIDSQYRDGTWGQWGNYRGGKTALVTYALLKSGVDVDHPAVRRAFLYLDDVIPNETYTIGCMMLCYAAAGRAMEDDRLEEWTERLLDWQRTGDWAYPHGNADLSNTQYAALGMWVAQKHGIKIPRKAWIDLADATLRYVGRETEVEVEATGEGTVRNGGMVEIAGFGYRKGTKATGSMTTAGISTLAICKIGLGSRAGRMRREADRAIDAGVEWLGHNFSVSKNPGHGGRWLFYYLYGMERSGALTRREQFGSHWWYVEGARELLKRQNEDQGHWGGGQQERATRTAFALLFLRRATAMEAATTGPGPSTDVVSHIFEGGSEKDAVMVGGAGQQPLAVWVPGFGEELQKRHEQFGLRVVKVEYLEGDDVLGQVGGDPNKAWLHDAYLFRVPALQRGEHEIHARVELVVPDAVPSDDEDLRTETIESPPMKVVIRDVFAPWMEQAARAAKSNLVALAEPVAEASSRNKEAKRACDGAENTHWVCDAGDTDPRIEVRLGDSVRASQLLLSQAGSSALDIGLFDRITTVEVTINRSGPMRVQLDPDQLAITSIPFERTRRVRQIEIRILDRVPGKRKGQAGFTEIALVE